MSRESWAAELVAEGTENREAIIAFLEANFSKPKTSQNPGRTEEATPLNGASYTFKAFGVSANLSEAAIKQLVQFMVEHHYDGAGLYEIDYNSENAPTWAQSIWDAIKNNNPITNPKAFLFQLLNLLEVTAILTAVWEKDPSYVPTAPVFVGLTLAALATVRSNHFYASALGKLSPERVETILQEIETLKTATVGELRALFGEDTSENTKAAEALLRLLTRPSRLSRLDTGLRAGVGYGIKLSAAAALFLQEMKALPFPLIMALAFFAGT
ncbi:MAG TPA: hypothetical protein VI844_01465, partial [Coxiellaceae bacterium]|nr:hypothetical protein [Coxiellaceae bacterium]